MANPRENPFISVTWLARVMAGEVACTWQYWFQVHNQLTDRMPDDFNTAVWQIDHTRMVSELRDELEKTGPRPLLAYQVRIPTPTGRGNIVGKLDCLVVDAAQFCVYDCKTGSQRVEHTIQVMLYMHALKQQPAYANKAAKGIVVYKDNRIEVPHLTDDFASNFELFTSMLTSKVAAHRYPGEDCKFCHITTEDCPERQS